jgi:LuxR family transcriptional regulator, maltose regulon positive regulatory protein
MDDTGMRQLGGRSPGVDRPVADLAASKSGRPPTRPGTIRRPLLIERLAQADPPIVSVVAPSGFGKTTLLSQWAEHDRRAFAWVQVEEPDNDPKTLLSHIARALDAIEPVGRQVFDALTSAGSSIAGSVVPRLGSALSSRTSPVTLVLDDVHVLRNPEGRAALSTLADYVPRGSRLVLSGQVEPPLRIARLRAEGRVVEIGPDDLSLTCEQASLLLRDAGIVLGEQEAAELYRRTEGWPVGLYLAALYLREGTPFGRVAASFGGDDLLVSEYVESEFLSRISRQQRVFLTRTAVLERICGSLCDAVLELSGSAEALADLAQSNLLLVPLDRRGKWYRYHNLFRDMLLAELDRVEPELIPVLRRRAAAWCTRNDLPEPALEYSIAAGDVEMVAELVGRLVLPTYQQGRVTTVQRWFRWLQDRGGIGKHPMAAVLASVVSAVTGRPAEAERWADVVDHWQFGDAVRPDDPRAEAWAALVRAVLCRHGVKQMRVDADEAVRRFAAEGIMAPIGALCQGLARMLSGDLDGGDVSFADAVNIATEAGAPEGLAEALSERALVAMARNEWRRAEGLADRALGTLRQAGIEDSYATTLVHAAAARVTLHQGDIQAARQHLTSTQRTRSLLTHALPHLAVQARIELIRVHLALGDVAGARTLMQEVNKLLGRRPGLGDLIGQAQALRDRLANESGSSAPEASSLTAAELRLLPMLCTHLSFAEIAAEMFLSRHTISSQAMSIYRKLGVGSRGQAVTRSRELGLLAG